MPGARFAFGPFVLNAESGTLLRQGVPVPIGYRGILLLAALLKNAGRGPHQVRPPRRRLAGHGGRGGQPHRPDRRRSASCSVRPPTGEDWIATVPRVGYRFAGAGRGFGGSRRARRSSQADPARAPRSPCCPSPTSATIREQQYFADGLAEDIITRLARLRWLFVSARNSSFTYKGKAVDVKQVGRELGVRYVLDGSVRRSGQRLRISAELSDASTGLQVWAERYDVDARRFLRPPGPDRRERRSPRSSRGSTRPSTSAFGAGSPESLDAWGFVMRAMPYVWTWGSAEEIETAQDLLEAGPRSSIPTTRGPTACSPGRTPPASSSAGDAARHARLGARDGAAGDPARSERSLGPFCGRLRPHGLARLRSRRSRN